MYEQQSIYRLFLLSSLCFLFIQSFLLLNHSHRREPSTSPALTTSSASQQEPTVSLVSFQSVWKSHIFLFHPLITLTWFCEGEPLWFHRDTVSSSALRSVIGCFLSRQIKSSTVIKNVCTFSFTSARKGKYRSFLSPSHWDISEK